MSTTSAISHITSLQELVADKLRADPYFADVEVLTELKGDIENAILRALGKVKGGGCAVIVLTPVLSCTKPNVPGPFFDDVLVQIRCIETPLINQAPAGAKKPALGLAIRSQEVLHHWTPAGFGAVIYAANPTVVGAPDAGPSEVIYDSFLKTSA